jgi:hypothetical protein
MPAVLVAVVVTAVGAPAAEANRCRTATDFDVYAIPSGYEDGTKDVFVAGVPRRAKHVRVTFVYAADGRPIKAKPFPLQTWTAKVRGFRGDGLLWVQIWLAGYGYGMPVANVTHWRALISYDC